MEVHSEKSGNLGGKFEGFTHPPREEVWERIAATPTDRPLGVRFRGFAWTPSVRVWRRIAAELHPQARRRALLAWSAAASVVMAVGMALLWPSATAPLAQPLAESQGKGAVRPKPGLGSHGEAQPIATIQASTGTTGLPTHPGRLTSEGPAHLSTTSHTGYHPSLYAAIPPAGGAASGMQATTGIPTAWEWLDSRIPTVRVADEEIAYRVRFWQGLQVEAGVERQRALLAELERPLPTTEDDPVLVARLGSSIAAGSRGNFKGDRILEDLNNFSGGGLGVTAAQDQAEREMVENFQSPVVIGAFVDRPVWKNLAATAGLVYTRMQSHVEAASGNVAERLDITRQYLGLAGGAAYSLPLSKRLGTYVNGGLQFDLGLGKHREWHRSVGDSVVDEATYNEKSGRQANVHLGLGLRYTLYKGIGLYVQGTAARYFLQTEPNLWSTRRMWPTLQVGIRVAL